MLVVEGFQKAAPGELVRAVPAQAAHDETADPTDSTEAQ